MMRVIAGTARSLPLKTVEGKDTRPTTDRIKETLFNMLQTRLSEAAFLDLFSGSGAIGIEALSRGASEACFVESNKVAAACIRENLEFTRLKDRAAVMECDAVSAIHRLQGKGKRFDIIFMDPPYEQQLEKQALEALRETDLLDEDTLIIVEAAKETDFSYVEAMGYTIEKQKEYKNNQHVWISRI